MKKQDCHRQREGFASEELAAACIVTTCHPSHISPLPASYVATCLPKNSSSMPRSLLPLTRSTEKGSLQLDLLRISPPWPSSPEVTIFPRPPSGARPPSTTLGTLDTSPNRWRRGGAREEWCQEPSWALSRCLEGGSWVTTCGRSSTSL